MDIKNTPQVENKERKIQLVDGEFTPSQASDIISSLIEQKINYHRLEGLQNWERNHTYDEEPLRNRIKELNDEMKRFKDFVSELKEKGKNVKIEGVIKMSVVE
jgi:hypothetical protein